VEIEAKFAVPDDETFRRLQALESLTGCTLSAGRIKRIHDTYLDTADRRILHAGYACRLRQQGDEHRMTLKGLGGVRGAIHRREEWEIVIQPGQPPAEWPAGPARAHLLGWIGTDPLLPLFTLRQTRLVRNICQGERVVAESSLDDVRVIVGEKETTYRELEIELAPQGTEAELTAIAAYLQTEWKLRPEPLSKFERAMGQFAAAPAGG